MNSGAADREADAVPARQGTREGPGTTPTPWTGPALFIAVAAGLAAFFWWFL